MRAREKVYIAIAKIVRLFNLKKQISRDLNLAAGGREKANTQQFHRNWNGLEIYFRLFSFHSNSEKEQESEENGEKSLFLTSITSDEMKMQRNKFNDFFASRQSRHANKSYSAPALEIPSRCDNSTKRRQSSFNYFQIFEYELLGAL